MGILEILATAFSASANTASLYGGIDTTLRYLKNKSLDELFVSSFRRATSKWANSLSAMSETNLPDAVGVDDEQLVRAIAHTPLSELSQQKPGELGSLVKHLAPRFLPAIIIVEPTGTTEEVLPFVERILTEALEGVIAGLPLSDTAFRQCLLRTAQDTLDSTLANNSHLSRVEELLLRLSSMQAGINPTAPILPAFVNANHRILSESVAFVGLDRYKRELYVKRDIEGSVYSYLSDEKERTAFLSLCTTLRSLASDLTADAELDEMLSPLSASTSTDVFVLGSQIRDACTFLTSRYSMDSALRALADPATLSARQLLTICHIAYHDFASHKYSAILRSRFGSPLSPPDSEDISSGDSASISELIGRAASLLRVCCNELRSVIEGKHSPVEDNCEALIFAPGDLLRAVPADQVSICILRLLAGTYINILRLYGVTSFDFEQQLDTAVLSQVDSTLLNTTRPYFILDRSGAGKTNLLCNVAETVFKTWRWPVVLLPGELIYQESNSLLECIRRIISSASSASASPDSFWETLRCELEAQNSYLVLLLDALNEVGTSIGLADTDLKRTFSHLSSLGIRVKYVISCRSDYWNSYVDGAYWATCAYSLSRGTLSFYSDSELTDALDKYFHHYSVNCYVSNETREKCKNPYILKLFAIAHQDQYSQASETFNYRAISETYLQHKLGALQRRHATGHDIVDYEFLLISVARLIYSNAVKGSSGNPIYFSRTEVAREWDQDYSLDALIDRLIDEDILASRGYRLKFRHDQFLGYLIAKHFFFRLEEEEHSRKALQTVLNDLVSVSHAFPVAYDSLDVLSWMLVDLERIYLWDSMVQSATMGSDSLLLLATLDSVLRSDLSSLSSSAAEILDTILSYDSEAANFRLIQALVWIHGSDMQERLIRGLLRSRHSSVRLQLLKLWDRIDILHKFWEDFLSDGCYEIWSTLLAREDGIPDNALVLLTTDKYSRLSMSVRYALTERFLERFSHAQHFDAAYITFLLDPNTSVRAHAADLYIRRFLNSSVPIQTDCALYAVLAVGTDVATLSDTLRSMQARNVRVDRLPSAVLQLDDATLQCLILEYMSSGTLQLDSEFLEKTLHSRHPRVKRAAFRTASRVLWPISDHDVFDLASSGIPMAMQLAFAVSNWSDQVKERVASLINIRYRETGDISFYNWERVDGTTNRIQ